MYVHVCVGVCVCEFVCEFVSECVCVLVYVTRKSENSFLLVFLTHATRRMRRREYHAIQLTV